MSMLSRLFRPKRKSTESDEPLYAVPIPPLVDVLSWKEQEKGAPLTEAEVLAIRDGVICMALPASNAEALAAGRGYRDISLENAWAEWQAHKASNLPSDS